MKNLNKWFYKTVAILIVIGLYLNIVDFFPGSSLIKEVKAGGVYESSGTTFVTTNEDGSILYVWRTYRSLGGYVVVHSAKEGTVKKKRFHVLDD